jgi:hypothetical protein
LKNNQTSPSHATQETTLWLVPIPNKIHLSQFVKKNLLLERGGLIRSSPPHPKKKSPFEKEKEILTPRPFFLKLHL